MHLLCSTLFNFIFLSSIWNVHVTQDYGHKKYGDIISFRMRRHLQPRDATNLPPCNEDSLMMFLAQLKAINPESIINLATDNDVSVTCGQLSDSLDAIDEFLGTCRVTTQGLYIRLIKGVDALYDTLCNSTYGISFQKYFPCYKALHNDYSTCVGPGDWVEFSDLDKLCNAYQDITDCYYVKTAKVCGIKAAKTMKMLNKAVINKVIGVRCCNVYKNPKVPDAYKMFASRGRQDVCMCTDKIVRALKIIFIDRGGDSYMYLIIDYAVRNSYI